MFITVLILLFFLGLHFIILLEKGKKLNNKNIINVFLHKINIIINIHIISMGIINILILFIILFFFYNNMFLYMNIRINPKRIDPNII